MSGSDPGLVDIGTLARLLMCTPAWIGRLVRSGHIPKTARGKYPLVGAVQGYIRHLTDPDRRRPEREAANRKSDARTREIELRIAERESRLIDIREHDEIVAALLDMTEQAARPLPGRIGGNAAMQERVRGEVADMLADLRSHAERRGRELRATGTVEAFARESVR